MYKVYWTEGDKPDTPCMADFDELKAALDYAQMLRSCGYDFVTMCSQDPNSVGKPGVDSVVDGLLPDGTAYEWKMRRTQ